MNAMKSNLFWYFMNAIKSNFVSIIHEGSEKNAFQYVKNNISVSMEKWVLYWNFEVSSVMQTYFWIVYLHYVLVE